MVGNLKQKEEIVDAVRDYLDYYNHRRIQLKLKGLSPNTISKTIL